MGPRWLDADKNPQIVFEVVSASDTTTAKITGNLTLMGVTREITVPIKMTYLKGMLQERGGTRQEGDLLVLRSKSTIRRDELGINPGETLAKVANEIELSLSLVGMSTY